MKKPSPKPWFDASTNKVIYTNKDDYISHLVELGYSDEEIRQRLEKLWTEDDVTSLSVRLKFLGARITKKRPLLGKAKEPVSKKDGELDLIDGLLGIAITALLVGAWIGPVLKVLLYAGPFVLVILIPVFFKWRDVFKD